MKKKVLKSVILGTLDDSYVYTTYKVISYILIIIITITYAVRTSQVFMHTRIPILPFPFTFRPVSQAFQLQAKPSETENGSYPGTILNPTGSDMYTLRVRLRLSKQFRY